MVHCGLTGPDTLEAGAKLPILQTVFGSTPPMHSTFSAIILTGAAGVFAGCTSASSNLPVYDSNQVGQVINEQRGEVILVREVLFKAPTAAAGSAGSGSRIGAATVAGIVTGSTHAVANAMGSVLGGAAGARADNRLGEEITVMVEGGQSVVIVQERDRNTAPLGVGERVKILSGSGGGGLYGGPTARVVRDTEYSPRF
jgi:outer membrane lipoprotein SlyB